MRGIGWLSVAALLSACAVSPARAPLPGHPVAEDIALLQGAFVPGRQPDGNSVLLRGKLGLIVVDTGRHSRHTQAIAEAARSSGLPIVAIVNTHWHLDHIAGNAMLLEAFPQAEVIASDAIDDALEGFLADYRAQLQTLIDEPGTAPPESIAAWGDEIRRIDAGEKLLPTRVVVGPQELELAGRRVRIGLERNAVSGGDVWLFDPATRTLVAGDLVTLPVPLFDTACTRGWHAALERLAAFEFDAMVPGHGAPLDREQFAAYRLAFDHLLQCAAGSEAPEACKAAWLRDAGALIPARDAPLANSLLDYYIPHVLRAPPERRERYCRKEPSL